MVAHVQPEFTPPPQETQESRRRPMSHYLGTYEAREREVYAVSTPPISGAHVPISHATVYEAVRDELGRMGVRLEETFHALYREGDRYIGLGVVEEAQARGRHTVVGWFNSHDKSKAVTLLFGERVFVCFNLLLTAQVRLARKHTRYVARDLPELVARGLSKLDDIRQVQAARHEAYLSTMLPPAAGHDLLVRLMDQKVFSASKIPRILAEWRTPSFDEHAQDRSLMRLHNAITYHSTGIHSLARRHAKMQETMDAWVGFDAQQVRSPYLLEP